MLLLVICALLVLKFVAASVVAEALVADKLVNPVALPPLTEMLPELKFVATNVVALPEVI